MSARYELITVNGGAYFGFRGTDRKYIINNGANALSLSVVLAYAPVVSECLIYNYVPPVVGYPTLTYIADISGWNAKATSKQKHFGNCFTEFTTPFVTGVGVGLTADHNSADPRALPYAFYMYAFNGVYYYCVYEYGVKITTPVARVSPKKLKLI